MRPLLTAAALFVFGATGCVVHEHGYYRDDGYRETQPILYSYNGAHPVPSGLGGGWCLVEGQHTHDYAPDYNAYAYNGTYYTYSGPTVVWYMDYHPVPNGGYCSLHGRHSHRYHPGYQYSSYYSYDSGHDYYVYRDPNPGSYHPATAVPASGSSQVPPPPGRGTYQAPPQGSYYGNRPPPPPGQGSYNPPSNHGAPPPPGRGTYNPPPGQGSYNPPPGHGGTPPGQGAPPPGHSRPPAVGGQQGNVIPPPSDNTPPPGHTRPPTVGGQQGNVIPPPSNNTPPPGHTRPPTVGGQQGNVIPPPSTHNPPPGSGSTPPPFDRGNPIERGNGDVVRPGVQQQRPPDRRERPDLPYKVDLPPPPERTFQRPPGIPQPNPGSPVEQQGQAKSRGKDKRVLPGKQVAPANARVRPAGPGGGMAPPPPPGRGAGH